VAVSKKNASDRKIFVDTTKNGIISLDMEASEAGQEGKKEEKK